MVLDKFRKLDVGEREHLSALPVYISALIAGADGIADKMELKRAIDFTKSIDFDADEAIIELYKEVNQDFEDKLKIVISNMPLKKSESRKYLISQIEMVNAILKKIEKPRAILLYESFQALAKNIATASGGIFGFGSIGEEESQLIDLKMVKNPNLV